MLGLAVVWAAGLAAPAGAPASSPGPGGDPSQAQPLGSGLPVAGMVDLSRAAPHPLTDRPAVWFRWTAEGGGVAPDNCSRQRIPTRVQFFAEGQDPVRLDLTCPDSGWPGPPMFWPSPGTTYLLAVEIPAGTTASSARFPLRLRRAGPPYNSTEQGAQRLGALPATAFGHHHQAKGAWYSWTPPSSGPVRVGTCRTAHGYHSIALDVYEDVGGDKRLVAADGRGVRCGPDRKVVFNAVAGRRYLIATWASDARRRGYFDLTVERAFPPANDTPAGAGVLRGSLPIAFAGQTGDATIWTPPSPPTGSWALNHPDIWWTWVPAHDVEAVVRHAGGSGGQISAWRGPTPRTMVFEEFNLLSADRRMAGSFRAGERYWFRVQTPGREGKIRLNLERKASGAMLEGAARRALTSGSGPARVDTVPITRRPGADPVSVTSVPLQRLGRLRGKRLAVAAEVQLTVCLKPSGNRRRGDCAGRMYGYDPKLSAHLVLSRRSGAAAGKATRRLTGSRKLTCTQRQPSRNHHCVIAIPWTTERLRRAPCLPARCRVNLVAAAHHPRARGGHRVIVGGIDHSGRIRTRGKAQIAVIQRGAKATVKTTRKRRSRGLRVAAVGRSPKKRVVYSVRVKARRGQALEVDGRHVASLAGLPYNARTRTAIVLADRPGATGPTRRAKQVSAGPARLSAETNFNCTRGGSGHRSPCAIRKSGVVGFSGSSSKPLYVNLVAGHGAIGNAAKHRWRGADRVKVGKGGYLKVRSYRR